MDERRKEYLRKYYKKHRKHINRLNRKYYALHPEWHYYGLSHYPMEVRRMYTKRIWEEVKREVKNG